MIEVRRFDRVALPGDIKRTGGGFIEADPVCTRTGIFNYRLQDGSIRRELRLPEEVFHADSLASARMIPITNGHPKDFVTSANVGELGIGTTGENARRDGDTLRVPIKITNKDGVEAVEGGRLQLSFGYNCNLEMKGGEWEGQRYDAVQSGIRYNHLALCDEARAGAQATLRLDSEDAVMVQTEPKRKETNMPDTAQLRLDSGVAYPVPPEVEAAVVKMRKDAETKAATVAEERAAATAKYDELQGKHDAVVKELEEEKKIDHADALTKGIKARVALVEKIKPMLSKEDAEKMDDLSDNALMVLAITATDEKFDGKDADGKDHSEAYLKPRFDGAVVAFEKSDEANKATGSAVVGNGERRNDAGTAAEARERMTARLDGTAESKDKDKK